MVVAKNVTLSWGGGVVPLQVINDQSLTVRANLDSVVIRNVIIKTLLKMALVRRL